MNKTLLLLINRTSGEIVTPGSLVKIQTGCIVREVVYVRPVSVARQGADNAQDRAGIVYIREPDQPDDGHHGTFIDDTSIPGCRVYAMELGDPSDGESEPPTATPEAATGLTVTQSRAHWSQVTVACENCAHGIGFRFEVLHNGAIVFSPGPDAEPWHLETFLKRHSN